MRKYLLSFGILVSLLVNIDFCLAQNLEVDRKRQTGEEQIARDTLALEDAVSKGLEQNFGIQISRNDVEIAENNNSLGNAGFLPEVSASGTYSKRIENTNIVFRDTERVSRKTSGAESTTKDAGVDLSWTIFDGMKMFASRDRLGQLQERSRGQLQATIEMTMANIIRSYTLIIQLQKTVSVLRNTLDVSAKRIEIAETKLDLGSGSEYELLQAKTAYNADQAALLQGERDLQNAKVELNRLISRDVKMAFAVSESIEVDEKLQFSSLLDNALISNTDLNIARINERVSQLEIKEIQAERLPELDLNAGYGYTRNESGSGIFEFNESDGFNFGLTARVNLFDGMNVHRRIQNAQIEANTEQLRQEQLRDQIESDLLTAYNSYQQGLRLIELEEENLSIAERSLSIALERFELGTIDFLELREAQRTYIAAQSRLITAQYQAKSSETELLRLSGQLVQ